MSDGAREQWVTEFGIQPFVLDRRRLRPEEPRIGFDKAKALRLGERLAAVKAGVVVFSRRSAPGLGDYEAPLVIARHGQVPEGIEDALAVV